METSSSNSNIDQTAKDTLGDIKFIKYRDIIGTALNILSEQLNIIVLIQEADNDSCK